MEEKEAEAILAPRANDHQAVPPAVVAAAGAAAHLWTRESLAKKRSSERIWSRRRSSERESGQEERSSEVLLPDKILHTTLARPPCALR
jgi:hypothetical protein